MAQNPDLQNPLLPSLATMTEALQSDGAILIMRVNGKLHSAHIGSLGYGETLKEFADVCVRATK